MRDICNQGEAVAQGPSAEGCRWLLRGAATKAKGGQQAAAGGRHVMQMEGE